MYKWEEGFCPYCHQRLNPIPKRKKECPFCHNNLFVRTRGMDGTKYLVTLDEAKMFEQEYASDGELERFYSRLNVTEEEAAVSQAELLRKFNVSTKEDILWTIYNKRVLEYSKSANWASLSWIYYEQALFLNWRGGDCSKLLRSAANATLMFYKNQGLKTMIIVASRSCEECQKMDGTIISIEEALKNGPIPCEKCTTVLYEGKKPFCRCLYSPYY